MRDKTILKVGDKVHYIPYKGADPTTYENGIVKSLHPDGASVFVVFHCASNWGDYQNYTGCLTHKSYLRKGWVENTKTSNY